MKKSSELDPLAPGPALNFSKGVRGKHFNLLQQGTNLAIIAPDLVDTFPDSEAVNDALRSLKSIAGRSAATTRRPSRKSSVPSLPKRQGQAQPQNRHDSGTLAAFHLKPPTHI